MKEIILNKINKTWRGQLVKKGYVALVDDDMFEYLNQWNWSLCKGKNTYYAILFTNDGIRKQIKMHRLIMEAKPGKWLTTGTATGYIITEVI